MICQQYKYYSILREGIRGGLVDQLVMLRRRRFGVAVYPQYLLRAGLPHIRADCLGSCHLLDGAQCLGEPSVGLRSRDIDSPLLV